jgi:hypothetical protein
VIIAFGALIGLGDTSYTYLLNPTVGRQQSFGRVAIVLLSYWMTFAALVPGVLFLAERWRLDRAPRGRALMIHGIGAVCFVTVHFGAAALLHMNPQSDLRLADRFFAMLRNYAAGNFLQYWAVVGLFYAAHYYHEARQHEVRAAQLQADLNHARLQALRSQLNPHFLFNTLNTIFVLAQKNDQRAVMETLSRLSELLRATLDDRGPQEIPLGEEIRFLERYIEIQRTRFVDRLTVEYDIAPEAEDALVPRMVLQPILENAIRYGVTAQCGHATITVGAAREGDELLMKVCDNGPGFVSSNADAHGRGIGLSNTQARLEHLYGRHHAITYGSLDATGGGVVTIAVPFRAGPETFSD